VITSPDGSRSWLSRALNLLGVAVVAFFTWRDTMPRVDAWVMALVWVALACWVATILLPRRRTAVTSLVLTVMVLSGAMVTVPTNGVVVVVVAVGLVILVVDLARPLWHGLTLGIAAAAIIPISSLYSPVTPLGIVSVEAGVVVALLAGVSRRQFRASETQARQLLEERVAAREEQARATVLASRQQVARDIHDVLAHSLGGLVIQLDAVDALLEAGRSAEAAGRVRDARELAVSGLAEARRAVDALRDVGADDGGGLPGSRADGGRADGSGADDGGAGILPRDLSTATDGLVDDLGALADAHRALGGTIEFEVWGASSAQTLAPDAVEAVRRAFQEALTNARKHAPGRPVTASLRWAADGALELRIENPVPVAVPSTTATATTGATTAASAATTTGPSSGGHGLRGMAERFEAVRGGSVRARDEGGRFVVLARVEAS
jgi:signal transduction histidine kinase